MVVHGKPKKVQNNLSCSLYVSSLRMILCCIINRYEATNSCQTFGHEFQNDQGLTANVACCACGGGLPLDLGAEDPVHAPSNQPSDIAVVCTDSPLKLLINNNTTKSCSWVSRNTEKRCKKKGVASHCPNTCNKCELFQCKDSNIRWYHKNDQTKKCSWVGSRNRVKRCNIPGVMDTCRETCQKCR